MDDLDLCECGHPKFRHHLGFGQCKWVQPKLIGEGREICKCPAYRAQITVTSRDNIEDSERS